MSSKAHLRDTPVLNTSDCGLGLEKYGHVLAEFVEECETPLTIGLQGDWGIGKTSLMNMIRERLESDVPQLDFNTWQYSIFAQEDQLALACMRALVVQLQEQAPSGDTVRSRASSTLSVFSHVLRSVKVSAGPVSIPVGEAVGEAIDSASQSGQPEGLEFKDLASLLTQFRDQFQKLVEAVLAARGADRLVVFVDDLDRVKPLRALELLEALKNFMEVEGCVFVVAVDYEVIQVGMTQKLGQDLQRTSGKSFFDKIINVPFNMPTMSYALGDYIAELINASGFLNTNIDDEAKGFYERVTTATVGRNPRNIKRVINYAKLLDMVREKEIPDYNKKLKEMAKKGKEVKQVQKNGRDMQVLYALMCMQVAWPELFAYLTQHPSPDTIRNLEDWEFLDALPEARRVLARTNDPESLKANIGAFVDELFELLDQNGDGEIDMEEMRPVLEMMELARMTRSGHSEPPLLKLQGRVRSYGNHVSADHNAAADFIRDVFSKSLWSDRGGVRYKISGNRYATIVLDRRQVGSLVTLKTRPFTFRVKPPVARVHERLRAMKKAGEAVPDRLFEEDVIVRLENTSLTGYGGTLIAWERIAELGRGPNGAVAALDALYHAVQQCESGHFARSGAVPALEESASAELAAT